MIHGESCRFVRRIPVIVLLLWTHGWQLLSKSRLVVDAGDIFFEGSSRLDDDSNNPGDMSSASLVDPKNRTILFDEMIARPGESTSGNLYAVAASPNEGNGDNDNNDHSTAFLPITIINGKQDGPTLLMLAGIHGSEYSPIVASQRLAQQFRNSTKTISGCLILVHIANMAAYLGRTVYKNPVDHKNLNRQFPGKRNGTLTERIAYTLTTKLFPLADAVLDAHSGDANEQLSPTYTAYYGNVQLASKNDHVNDALIHASKAMAEAFGTRYVVEFQWPILTPNDGIWAGSAAIAQGVPSIDVEVEPGMGLYSMEGIEQVQKGVIRIMHHLGMVDSATQQQQEDLPLPTIIKERKYVEAPMDGSWVPLIDTGSFVKQGDLIGYMTDWYGERIYDAKSPIDGLLLIRLGAPPASKGDTLAVIAAVPIESIKDSNDKVETSLSHQDGTDSFESTVWVALGSFFAGVLSTFLGLRYSHAMNIGSRQYRQDYHLSKSEEDEGIAMVSTTS